LKIAKAIEPKEVLKEQKLLEEEILKALAQTSDEQTLLKCSKQLSLYKKLLSLTMTPEDYKEYKESSRNFTVTHLTGFLNKKIMDQRQFYEDAVFLEPGFEPTVQNAESFYELTYDRDQKMVENMLEKLIEDRRLKIEGVPSSILDPQSAVLITGGYHTPNLKHLLKQKNIGIYHSSLKYFMSSKINQVSYFCFGLEKVPQFFTIVCSYPFVAGNKARKTIQS